MFSVVNNGVLNWAIVVSCVYLTILLLGADVIWRRSGIGGKRLLGVVTLLGAAGVIAIFALQA